MILRRKLQNGETNEQLNDLLTNLPENNNHIANYIFEHNGQLPPQPMFEKHPYLDTFELQNFEKYIIGTFPPISYLYNTHGLNIINNPNGGVIRRPGFSFFHGNRGLLWDYFLSENEIIELPEDNVLKPNFIQNILLNSKVNYCDIIYNVRRELEDNKYKGSDNLLFNIAPNLILIKHILNNPKAKYLMFNTASIYGMNGLEVQNNSLISLENDAKSFDVFMRTLQELEFDLSLSFDNGANWVAIENLNLLQRRVKLFFKLKIKKPNFQEKVFYIVTPFSPAVAQRVNILANNPIVQNWRMNNENNNTQVMLSQIMNYFRNNNWDDLQAMNVNI